VDWKDVTRKPGMDVGAYKSPGAGGTGGVGVVWLSFRETGAGAEKRLLNFFLKGDVDEGTGSTVCGTAGRRRTKLMCVHYIRHAAFCGYGSIWRETTSSAAWCATEASHTCISSSEHPLDALCLLFIGIVRVPIQCL